MSYVLDAGNENSKVIHITSTDATHQLSSDGAYLQYNLETPIITPQDQDTLVSLYSAVIPYSFYNIRKDINDRVYIRIETRGLTTFFVIPEGSYTINSLKDTLTTLFNSGSAGDGSGSLNIDSETSIAYSRITMKFQFIQTQSGGSGPFVDWYFDFGDGVRGAETALGLAEGYTGQPADFLTIGNNRFGMFSTQVPDVNGDTHSLNIRTNLSSKGCIDSHTKSFSTILGTIPIDVNFGGVVFFRPADAIHKIIIQQKAIKTITIRLTDDRDRLLNLNGLSFNITLLIDHIKHGRSNQRRIRPHLQSQEEKPKRGRPKKTDTQFTRETKKDIPIPLIN